MYFILTNCYGIIEGMKEHQLLIGLGLIALAIYFGLQNITLTEFDACMKHAPKDTALSNENEHAYFCRLMIRGPN